MIHIAEFQFSSGLISNVETIWWYIWISMKGLLIGIAFYFVYKIFWAFVLKVARLFEKKNRNE
jgi:hypothetical protein